MQSTTAESQDQIDSSFVDQMSTFDDEEKQIRAKRIDEIKAAALRIISEHFTNKIFQTTDSLTEWIQSHKMLGASAEVRTQFFDVLHQVDQICIQELELLDKRRMTIVEQRIFEIRMKGSMVLSTPEFSLLMNPIHHVQRQKSGAHRHVSADVLFADTLYQVSNDLSEGKVLLIPIDIVHSNDQAALCIEQSHDGKPVDHHDCSFILPRGDDRFRFECTDSQLRRLFSLYEHPQDARDSFMAQNKHTQCNHQIRLPMSTLRLPGIGTGRKWEPILSGPDQMEHKPFFYDFANLQMRDIEKTLSHPFPSIFS